MTPDQTTARSLRPDRGPELRLVASNGADASSRQLLALAFDVVALSVVGVSAAQLGVLDMLGSLAFLLLSVPLGVLVDRHVSPGFIAGATALRGVVVGVLLFALQAHLLGFWLLAVLSFLVGLVSVVVETAQTAVVPAVAGEGRVPVLTARLASADEALNLIVPGVGGLILGVLGAPPVLAAALVLALCGALLLVGTRTRQASTIEEGPSGSGEAEDSLGTMGRFLREALVGWSTLRGATVLWRLTLATMLINFGLALYTPLETFVVLREAHLGPAVLGWVVAAGGVGGLLASMVASRCVDRLGESRTTMLGGLVVLAAPVLFLGGVLGWPGRVVFLLAGAAVWGAGIVLYNVAVSAVTAAAVPAKVLGRLVSTRRFLTMGVAPAGTLVGGALIDVSSSGVTVLVWLGLNAASLAVIAAARAGRE